MALALAEIEQRLAALPREEQGQRRALLSRVSELVVETPLDQITPLVNELVEGSAHARDAAAWSLAEAHTRNLEHLLEDQAKLVRESISTARVRAGMNVSRQRLHQLIAQDRLVAIQFQDGAAGLFPFWQFTSEMPIKAIDGLPRLIETARQAGLDMLMLHFFMVEPNERLHGRAPYELVAEGHLDQVLAVLASAGLGSF